MANIELPKDAEGREIPLNTETLYTDSGPIFRVEKFEYVRSMGWCIYGYGGIWQFVYCAACGARGDGDPMDASGARDQWNRGPIQIRAEVA